MKFNAFVLNSMTIVLLLMEPVFSQSTDTTIIVSKDTIEITADKYYQFPNINSVASKMALPLHKTPASVGVVTARVLKAQNATVLSDALRNISSINVQSNLGTQDYFLIRGFESTTASLILMDGMMTPDMSMFKIYGFGFYDLYNVDQVEVLKGPASFLYGANTLSGAINLVRKTPIPKNFADISYSIGKYNTKRGTVDVGVVNKTGDLLFRLNGLVQCNEQYRKEKYRKSFAINPSIKWAINKSTFLSINLEYINNFSIPDAGIPLYNPDGKWRLPKIPMDMSFQTPLDLSKQEIFRFQMSYEKDTKRALTIKSKMYFAHLKGNTDITALHIPHRDVGRSWLLDRHMYSFEETQEVFSHQNEALFTFTTGSLNHKLLLGFESSFLKNKSNRALSILPQTLLFYHSESVANYNDIFRLQDIYSNANSSVLAPYLVHYISFSEQIQLLYGSRYDIINFKVDRRNAPFDFFRMILASVPERYSQTYQKFSPMIGLIIRDSENLWFYANAGESFSQGVRVTDEPINSVQYEAGYKYQSNDGYIRNSLALYSLVKEHIAIPLQRPMVGEKYEMSGNQRSRGLEFEIAAQPYENWHLFFTYAFTLADLLKYNAFYVDENLKTDLGDFTDNTPAFIPAHLLNIWSTKKFTNGLGLGFGITYTGKQYVYVDNDYEIGGSFIYNATVFFESDKWNSRLNLKNISGTQYFTRGFGPYSVIPNNSPMVSGTMNFSF